MDYKTILETARTCIGPYCKACPVCNGKACGNTVPGPGAKAPGSGFIRNYDKWQSICVNMDTICENLPVDTTVKLFDKTYAYPFFAAPVGAMKLHYGDKYDDLEYNRILVSACADAGIAAFTGDGTNPAVFDGAMDAIQRSGGVGVPTIKPWHMELVKQKLDKAAASGCPLPFVIKGIMTVRGAEKALQAGASGIVVSNHGGRVLGATPATAEVLPAIADAVKGKMKIFVDGGIRSGTDVFKALALGADAVLIGRPFVTMVYGGGAEGVQTYVDKIGGELKDTMAMCGVHSLKEITRDCITMFDE